MSAPATPADERLDLLAAVQRATNYVLGVVLFAAALFFAGMSARPATPRPAPDPARVRRHPLRRHGRLDRHLPDQHLDLTWISA
jgi:hypothetical protein